MIKIDLDYCCENDAEKLIKMCLNKRIFYDCGNGLYVR